MRSPSSRSTVATENSNCSILNKNKYLGFETEPFAPVSGTIEHSGTVTLSLGESEVTLGEFSIGFDAERISETTSGFFVADTTDDALGLEILFDVGTPGSLSADGEFNASEADLLLAPELVDALGSPDLVLADIGDTRIDATVVGVESETSPKAEISDAVIEGESGTAKNVIIMVGDGMGWEIARAAAIQQQINAGATGNTLADFYTEGTGTGLSFQNLDGYAIATTGGTYIDGSKSNSALKGDPFARETGVSV